MLSNINVIFRISWVWLLHYFRVQMVHGVMKQCSPKQLVHISVVEYDAVFHTVQDVSHQDRRQCVMMCLKLNQQIKVSVHDNELQLCACVNRMVQSTRQTYNTREVHVVDFNRAGRSYNTYIVLTPYCSIICLHQ